MKPACRSVAAGGVTGVGASDPVRGAVVEQPASTVAANRAQCLRLKKVAESIMPPWWRAGRWAATQRGVKRACAWSRHLQQQRVQDAQVFSIQRLRQVVAATEAAVEGSDGGVAVPRRPRAARRRNRPRPAAATGRNGSDPACASAPGRHGRSPGAAECSTGW
ncbi:hypothetical protein G6F24_016438 [Rhizopus arrhizus]|nr:hypothetical protein G6F24_016438 [Rhizopus arrhizus]